MSGFLWDMAKLFLEVQLQKANYEAAMRNITPEVKKEKPILPFVLDDIVGKDGTHCLIVAAMGLGKSNLLGHIERLALPRVQEKKLSFYAIDPKGDLLMYLSEYPEVQMFDSQRGMVGWRPLQRREGIPIERQATWFVDAFKAAWRDDIETARLENHVFNATVPMLEHNESLLYVLDILYGKPVVTAYEDVRKHWDDFHKQNKGYKAMVTESAKNRLGRFVQDPLVRELCAYDPPWNPREYIREGCYLFDSLPFWQPLSERHSIFLQTLRLHTIIQEKLNLGKKAPPLVIAIDEAELFLVHDTGLLKYLMRAGRGLGIHLILVVHDLSEVVGKPDYMGGLRTNFQMKIIGGGVFNENMLMLAQDVFGSEWAADIVRVEWKNEAGDVIAQQLMEMNVFLASKAIDANKQSAGNFFLKYKNKPVVRFQVPFLETREV